jgi:hypothetical protein
MEPWEAAIFQLACTLWMQQVYYKDPKLWEPNDDVKVCMSHFVKHVHLYSSIPLQADIRGLCWAVLLSPNIQLYKGNTALAVMVCVMFFFNLNSVISRTQRCVKEYTPIGLAENWADHKAMSEKLEELIIGMLNTLRSELKSTVSN